MTIRGKHIIVGLILGVAACANLGAGTLPPGDTLLIRLDPLDGAVHGSPGATVGWGFTVTWISTTDWITFTGSSLGSVAPGGTETNPSVLAAYTDFIGSQGGPDPTYFAISPRFGPWTQTFDGISQGIGSYQITSDPTQVGANDTGEITINYEVWNGPPGALGSSATGTGYGDSTYYGPSTAFSVTVDATSTPEPGSFDLLLTGAAALCTAAWRARRRRAGAGASGV